MAENTKNIKEQKIDESLVKEEVDLRSLVERSIQLSEEVLVQNKKINKRLRNMVWSSYLRLALIVIPIVIGIIYLPPVFSQIFSQYKDILGMGTGLSADQLTNINTSSQIKEIIELLKK